jgi:HEAT repeat protein
VRSLLRKSIALTVLLTYSSTQVVLGSWTRSGGLSLSGAPVALPKESKADLSPILRALPRTVGAVRKIFPQRGRGRVVIHIQDVHRNQEAQANISAAVQALIDNKIVDMVALEAAFTPLNFSWYRAYRFKDVVKAVADYLLRENRISGPVYAALTSSAAIPRFVGIDEKARYDANVEAYRKSAPLISSYKKIVEAKARALEKAKATTFNPALRNFDAHLQAYRNGSLAWEEYVRFLANQTQHVSPNVNNFLGALDLERKINFAQAESSRTRLLSRLASKLNKAETENLLRYTRYVLLSKKLDVDALLKETADLEKELYRSLAKNDEERRLIQQSRLNFLVSRLLDFSLTKQEWADYEQTVHGDYLGKSLRSFEDFYREAQARDQAMAKNLDKAMTAANSKVAVVVTGGFHAEGMLRYLHAMGMTVISYVPKISKVDDARGAASLSAFAREKTPLDKLFAGEQLFLGANPAQISHADQLSETAAIVFHPGYQPILRGLHLSGKKQNEATTTDSDGIVMTVAAERMGKELKINRVEVESKDTSPDFTLDLLMQAIVSLTIVSYFWTNILSWLNTPWPKQAALHLPGMNPSPVFVTIPVLLLVVGMSVVDNLKGAGNGDPAPDSAVKRLRHALANETRPDRRNLLMQKLSSIDSPEAVDVLAAQIRRRRVADPDEITRNEAMAIKALLFAKTPGALERLATFVLSPDDVKNSPLSKEQLSKEEMDSLVDISELVDRRLYTDHTDLIQKMLNSFELKFLLAKRDGLSRAVLSAIEDRFADAAGAVEKLARLQNGGPGLNPFVAESAAIGISNVRNVSEIPALLRLLQSHNDRMVWGAATALGYTGDVEVVASLLPVLKHRNFQVRQTVGQSIYKLRSPIRKEEDMGLYHMFVHELPSAKPPASGRMSFWNGMGGIAYSPLTKPLVERLRVRIEQIIANMPRPLVRRMQDHFIAKRLSWEIQLDPALPDSVIEHSDHALLLHLGRDVIDGGNIDGLALMNFIAECLVAQFLPEYDRLVKRGVSNENAYLKIEVLKRILNHKDNLAFSYIAPDWDMRSPSDQQILKAKYKNIYSNVLHSETHLGQWHIFQAIRTDRDPLFVVGSYIYLLEKKHPDLDAHDYARIFESVAAFDVLPQVSFARLGSVVTDFLRSEEDEWDEFAETSEYPFYFNSSAYLSDIRDMLFKTTLQNNFYTAIAALLRHFLPWDKADINHEVLRLLEKRTFESADRRAAIADAITELLTRTLGSAALGALKQCFIHGGGPFRLYFDLIADLPEGVDADAYAYMRPPHEVEEAQEYDEMATLPVSDDPNDWVRHLFPLDAPAGAVRSSVVRKNKFSKRYQPIINSEGHPDLPVRPYEKDRRAQQEEQRRTGLPPQIKNYHGGDPINAGVIGNDGNGSERDIDRFLKEYPGHPADSRTALMELFQTMGREDLANDLARLEELLMRKVLFVEDIPVIARLATNPSGNHDDALRDIESLLTSQYRKEELRAPLLMRGDLNGFLWKLVQNLNDRSLAISGIRKCLQSGLSRQDVDGILTPLSRYPNIGRFFLTLGFLFLDGKIEKEDVAKLFYPLFKENPEISYLNYAVTTGLLENDAVGKDGFVEFVRPFLIPGGEMYLDEVLLQLNILMTERSDYWSPREIMEYIRPLAEAGKNHVELLVRSLGEAVDGGILEKEDVPNFILPIVHALGENIDNALYDYRSDHEPGIPVQATDFLQSRMFRVAVARHRDHPTVEAVNRDLVVPLIETVLSGPPKHVDSEKLIETRDSLLGAPLEILNLIADFFNADFSKEHRIDLVRKLVATGSPIAKRALDAELRISQDAEMTAAIREAVANPRRLFGLQSRKDRREIDGAS